MKTVCVYKQAGILMENDALLPILIRQQGYCD